MVCVGADLSLSIPHTRIAQRLLWPGLSNLEPEMKKVLALAIGVFGISSAAHAATAPVQRVDVVNLLAHSKSAPGVTASPVTVKFFTSTSATTPCATSTLPYDGATSIFAGTGLACTTAITNISVTPLVGPGNIVAYSALTGSGGNFTATGKFSTQLEIIEGTAPTFTAANGALASAGTVSITQQQSAE